MLNNTKFHRNMDNLMNRYDNPIMCSFHAPLQTHNKRIPRYLLHALHSKGAASENKTQLLLNLRRRMAAYRAAAVSDSVNVPL
jgi:hypothetical protein